MLKITILFTVIILTDILVSHVNTLPMPGLDIQNLLQSLQKQMQHDQQFQQRNPSFDNEENEENHFGSLKREDLDSIVPLEASDDKYRNNRDDSRNAVRVERLAKQVLEQVLQDRNRQNRAEGRAKKRNDVSNLLYFNKDDNNNNDENDNQDSDSTESDDNKEDVNIGSLSDYSKVYVVLNSEAIKNSKNVNMLNDLLSSLLSAPPSRTRGTKKQSRYKGFLMNEGVRRTNRESGESKHMKIEDERPRRPQSYGGHGGGGHGGRGGRGGGGGGSNSRTAIPYMKQHGDIYEKDD